MPYKKANRQIKRTSTPVRLSFPELFEPRVPVINGKPSGDPKFSARIVIPASNTQLLAEVERLIEEVKNEAWADGGVPMKFETPLKDANRAYPQDANIKDCFVLNGKSVASSPPIVVKAGPIKGKPVPVDPSSDRSLIFSGMEAYVSIALYSYLNTPADGGIAVGLNAVYVTQRDVGRFDSRVSAESAFGDIAEADEAANPFEGMASAPPPPPGAVAAPPPPRRPLRPLRRLTRPGMPSNG